MLRGQNNVLLNIVYSDVVLLTLSSAVDLHILYSRLLGICLLSCSTSDIRIGCEPLLECSRNS